MTDELTLTQHDQAVRAAIDAVVAWGDACCMKCLAAEAKIDDVVRAAEARGVWLARERLAELTAALDRAMVAAELGVFGDGDDPYRAINTLLAQAQGLAIAELRERLAVVTAQRDALVPLALAWLDEEAKECDDHFVPLEAVLKAEAALAAIRAERTTTTEGGQGK